MHQVQPESVHLEVGGRTLLRRTRTKLAHSQEDVHIMPPWRPLLLCWEMRWSGIGSDRKLKCNLSPMSPLDLSPPSHEQLPLHHTSHFTLHTSHFTLLAATTGRRRLGLCGIRIYPLTM